MPSSGLRGWIGPLLVTVLAGLLRFVDLARPDAIIFDETYYVKDALALLRFGYEREAVDGADDMILARTRPGTSSTSSRTPPRSWCIRRWASGSSPPASGRSG